MHTALELGSATPAPHIANLTSANVLAHKRSPRRGRHAVNHPVGGSSPSPGASESLTGRILTESLNLCWHDFRAALTARGLPYCVQVATSVKGWTTAPPAPPPYAGRGRPRRRPSDQDIPPSHDLPALAAALPATAWRSITRRAGTTGPLRSRFAATAFWPAPGVSSRGPLPTAPVQLLIEWPTAAAAPIKYWLASLGDEALGLRRLVRLAKGRWRIEQDYRELKDELGLDHFEGRSWPGWHHHITLASMAYAFLVCETLRGKKTAGLTLPAVRRALQALLIRLGTWCPACRRSRNDSS